jgi:hypothetical protein
MTILSFLFNHWVLYREWSILVIRWHQYTDIVHLTYLFILLTLLFLVLQIIFKLWYLTYQCINDSPIHIMVIQCKLLVNIVHSFFNREYWVTVFYSILTITQAFMHFFPFKRKVLRWKTLLLSLLSSQIHISLHSIIFLYFPVYPHIVTNLSIQWTTNLHLILNSTLTYPLIILSFYLIIPFFLDCTTQINKLLCYFFACITICIIRILQLLKEIYLLIQTINSLLFLRY